MELPDKPLSETELRRYWKALKQWDLALQKQERELDEREAELDGEPAFVQEGDDDSYFVSPSLSSETREQVREVARKLFPQAREVPCPKSLVFDDDGCTITPEEFATTIKCGSGCCDGAHLNDCPVNVYLEVERLAKLEDKRP